MADGTVVLDVVFDGRCGVCTRAAAWLERRDRRGRLRLHPSQRPGVLERFGLSEAAAQEAAWVFEGEGPAARSYRGAAAVSRALDTAFGLRLLLPLYRLPGVGWAEDLAYRWVAENRRRLPGATPWCETHPGDCGK
ncbi:thiol-disulfide oxidoreductase DCC family protein [Leucobacter soli]|uniref:DUF393 domain-containing protein n=1 Tax=Leucobacter soli TaxID=2812850 RepID=A0A916K288_9MICO|nr:DCC1-like thiol-disulfide oxidoreductase family protein [Leucobacter soli]CAG7619530.1 hypothetical protein LEUCIP111803_02300 [Leucobacter soli]